MLGLEWQAFPQGIASFEEEENVVAGDKILDISYWND